MTVQTSNRIEPQHDMPSGVTCTGCQTTNQQHSKFCSSCGQSLHRPCPNCGNECPLDIRFCGDCGTNLADLDQQRTEKIETLLAQAGQLRESLQFAEAIALLKGVQTTDDPLLKPHVQRCQALAGEIHSQWHAEQTKVELVYQQVERRMTDHDYDAALALVANVPAPLRSEPLRRLAVEAVRRSQEVAQLAAEIRTAIERKETLDLLPDVLRLLELKPDHRQARELATQLQTALVQSAKKRLANHRYAAALELLNKIPLEMHDENTRRLLETATEFDCLTKAIEQAPFADANLLALAERMVKLLPTNEAGHATLAKAQKQCTRKPSDPRQHAVEWAPAAADKPLGVEVSWLAAPSQFAKQSRVEGAMFRQHPGCFFVAIGLALQALGRSTVAINLVPPKPKTGLLGKLTLRRPVQPLTAWGIDVGRSALKAVKLSFDPKLDVVTLEVAELIPFDRVLGDPEVELSRSELVKTALCELQSRHTLEQHAIATNLPSIRVLGRFFHLPETQSKKLNELIEFEIKHQLPVALDELCYGFASVRVPGPPEGAGSHRVMLIAAKLADAKRHLTIFDELGIDVDVLQCDSVAMHNFAVAEGLIGSPAGWAPSVDSGPAASEKGDRSANVRDHTSTIAIADFGSEVVNVLVSSPDQLWFRTLPVSGNDATKALVKSENLTFHQAESLKRSPAKARRLHAYCDALEPVMQRLVGELQRSLEAFAKEHPHQRITKLYVCGGGVQLHGLLARLRGSASDVVPLERKR